MVVSVVENNVSVFNLNSKVLLGQQDSDASAEGRTLILVYKSRSEICVLGTQGQDATSWYAIYDKFR